MKKDDKYSNISSKIKVLEFIFESAGKSKYYIKLVMSLFKKESQITRPEDLNETVKHTVKLAKKLLKNTSEVFLVLEENKKKVSVDENLLSQELVNLLVKADDEMTKKGNITIITETIFLPEDKLIQSPKFKEGDYIKIFLSASSMENVKNKTKNKSESILKVDRNGKGLMEDIAAACRITRNFNGFIIVESKTGEKTSFFIYIPASNN